MKRYILVVACMIFPASFLLAQIPTNGLVAYYPFNGDASDESGNGNDGIIYEALFTSDRFDNANSALYSATGEECVEILDANSLDLTTSYSISVWVNPDGSYGVGPDYHAIISKWGVTGVASYTLNIVTSGVIRLVTNDGSLNTAGTGVTPIDLNSWTHIVAVQNWDTIRIYQNGELETVTTGCRIPLVTNTNIYIGNNGGEDAPEGLDRAFNGYIDDVRIYNKALSIDEVSLLYTEYQCFETIYDTITTEVFDTTFVTIRDTLTTEVFDTTYVTIQDTLTTEVFDTTYITVVDSIAVTDTLIIDAVLTGISPPDNINTIKVYPNPANDHIFINTGDYTKMDGYQLKIIDQLGAIVFDTNVEEPLYQVDLSTWSGLGIYYIQVIDSGGSIIESRKIILH